MVMLPDVKDKTEESVRETGNKAPVFLGMKDIV